MFVVMILEICQYYLNIGYHWLPVDCIHLLLMSEKFSFVMLVLYSMIIIIYLSILKIEQIQKQLTITERPVGPGFCNFQVM